jgi:hypothetical protein
MNEALRGPRGGFAEGADGAAIDLVGDDSSVSTSAGTPLPAAMRSVIFASTGTPSRQGVHWPQLSWA